MSLFDFICPLCNGKCESETTNIYENIGKNYIYSFHKGNQIDCPMRLRWFDFSVRWRITDTKEYADRMQKCLDEYYTTVKEELLKDL